MLNLHKLGARAALFCLAMLLGFSLMPLAAFASPDSEDIDTSLREVMVSLADGMETDVAASPPPSPAALPAGDANGPEAPGNLGEPEPEAGATSDIQPYDLAGDLAEDLPETADETTDETTNEAANETSDEAASSTTGQRAAETGGEAATEADPDAPSATDPSADEEPLSFNYVLPPTLPQAGRAMLSRAAGPVPPTIVAEVTLYPPPYNYSLTTPGLFGFRGEAWVHISENGFTSAYNHVVLISGYDGDDWLYGISGDAEHNAVFSPNRTVQCIDPGLNAPAPGTDNTRAITMSYIEEILIDGQVYYLYWGFSTFGYDPTYAYSPYPQRMGLFIAIPKSYDIELVKLDAESHEPVADTEFSLLSYPVAVEQGLVTSDVSRIAADDPAWRSVATLSTGRDGKLLFAGLPFGYYQIVESKPNPLYMELAESGGEARFVKLDRYTTSELQVFYDELIQISVEVYKDTINQTSAAFRTDAEDYVYVDNTADEVYQYDLYFRSTSNVRADEFTVIDPLENVAAGQVRITELFTPVAWGDSDGRFNLWYQTNRTDPGRLYSSVSAMDSNPANPNNPNRQQVWPSVGWQLWRSGLSTTSSQRLPVSGLGLADGEYITALRFEYGSVEVGFTTYNGPIAAQQLAKPAKPLSTDWEPGAADSFYAEGAVFATGLKPASYLVICPQGLEPPTVITSSVTAYIARNVVLTDSDRDSVSTRVIASFMLPTEPYVPSEAIIIISEPSFEPYIPDYPDTPPIYYVPRTGDSLGIALAWAAAVIAVGTACLAVWRGRRNQEAEES
ncbi:MAG: prealbumin-like fold domain-containing protein, partial [Coriobacteriia bacterium]|nr:prealbumin-like fold domain-containing protein [Coriobacteriia bacterium]